jgi:hypothetical protein
MGITQLLVINAPERSVFLMHDIILKGATIAIQTQRDYLVHTSKVLSWIQINLSSRNEIRIYFKVQETEKSTLKVTMITI